MTKTKPQKFCERYVAEHKWEDDVITDLCFEINKKLGHRPGDGKHWPKEWADAYASVVNKR